MKEKKLKKALKEQKARKPHDYYIPNGKCEKFIKLVGSDEIFVNILSAANGVGKTCVGANIVANICYKTKNKFFKGLPLFENFPYVKRGRVISDSTAIDKIIVPEIKKWFPKDRYKTSKSGKMYESEWETDTGFKFDVMTYNQAPSEFESATLGFAWFDEPPPLVIYKATVARMRAGGIIFITETPLSGSAWLYDNLVASPDRIKLKSILKKYNLEKWNEDKQKKWKKRFSEMTIDERLGS